MVGESLNQREINLIRLRFNAGAKTFDNRFILTKGDHNQMNASKAIVLGNAAERFDQRESQRSNNQTIIDYLDTGSDFDWKEIEQAERIATRAEQLGMPEDAAAVRQRENDAAVRRIFERIIGANNLLDVSFLLNGARLSQCVGRIVLPVSGGRRLGTGFMVSPRVLMTNNHVLESVQEAADARVEFDFYTRNDDTVGPAKRFSMQPDLFFITDVALDYTLVAVEPVNAAGDSVADRGWLRLIGPSGKALVGERVSIIHHPNGDPQQVSLHENRVVDVDFGDSFIHYTTDTMGGSSGAPVLNINWELVALHHAAVGNNNEGVRISSIVADIQNQTSNEAGGTPHTDATLLAELLAGQEPPTISTPPRSFVPSSGPIRDEGLPKLPPPPTTPMPNPRLNADGTASWTVPVTLTVDVGTVAQASQAASQASTAVTATTAHSRSSTANAQADHPALHGALQALENTAGRTYYSKVKDELAIAAYYPPLETLNALDPDALFDMLSLLLADTHTTTLSYKKARLEHLYPWIDRRDGPGRTLRGIYSNKVFDSRELIEQEVMMEVKRERMMQERLNQPMALEALGDDGFMRDLETSHPFNCEHVVPQSWFDRRKQPKTDLHHLFTCEWGCNSFRGNRAYFEFTEEAFRDNCGESDDGKFEPARGKGAVARATLYFLLRYPGEIADSAKEMPLDRLQTLIDWSKSDKVDRWERHRNAEIQKVQGNRNPLIDFPDLVDKINFALAWV